MKLFDPTISSNFPPAVRVRETYIWDKNDTNTTSQAGKTEQEIVMTHTGFALLVVSKATVALGIAVLVA